MNEREGQLRELMTRGLSGNARSYNDFLTQMSAYLRGFFRARLSRIPDEVEDLVQETLLAVHNQRHTYDPAQPLSAWVHAIARYKLVDLLRRRGGREALTDTLTEEHELLASPENEEVTTRRDLFKLLDGLPDRQRLPILHVKVEGLSVLETARATGTSESAVKVGVHRGMKALAAMLRRQK